MDGASTGAGRPVRVLLAVHRPLAFALLLISMTVPGSIDRPAAALGVNGKIAFASARTGNQDIFLMNADGSGQAQVTRDPTVSFHPAWSPDGTRIAFAGTREENTDIYVMNADGTGETRLTTDPAIDDQPVWSPDGTKIAF
ncbi:MAG TPA: hypothetical protein VJS45_07905, partial [Acidimicrobiia bacterium]|nr:hypothetical protein [Acidimicrobiia bacterium]